MTALDALKKEQSATQRKMAKIVLDCGIVPRSKMYEYKDLVEYNKQIKECIAWFEKEISRL